MYQIKNDMEKKMKTLTTIVLALALFTTIALADDGHSGTGGFADDGHSGTGGAVCEGHSGAGGYVCEGHSGTGGYADDGHSGTGGYTTDCPSDCPLYGQESNIVAKSEDDGSIYFTVKQFISEFIY